MDARAERLRSMIPVHRKRETAALDKAAKAGRRIEGPAIDVLEQIQLHRTQTAELRRAMTEANTCAWYEYCIKQWGSE